MMGTSKRLEHLPARHRLLGGFAAALALLLLTPAFAAAMSAKSVVGYFGTTGTGAGQLSTPHGVAVDQTSGNVYVVDGTNRVGEFNSNGEFLRAFGEDVVESGPDNNGTGFEICVPSAGDVCKAGVSAAAGGGLNSPQGIAINQETGNLYVTDEGNLRVDEFSENGSFIAAFGEEVVESGPDKATPTSAVQTLTVSATGGNYTLSFGGHSTAELPFGANASSIQAALTGLASIGSGNLTVSEATAGVFTMSFAGALAHNPEPLIVAASGSGEPLSGGSAAVASTTAGATGFDVCVAANGDVCKAGVSGSTGGAFKATFSGYPAVAPAGAPNAGDVLVADPANLRVQEFSASGVFIRAFGFNAVVAGPDNNGTTSFEVCSAAGGDACGAGATGSGVGQFATNSLTRVAEDASGNLYTVESSTNFRVQRFEIGASSVTPKGNFDEADTKGTSAANGPSEVEVDPGTGDVLVVKAFAAGATPSCPGTGVASAAERRVLEISSAGALQATHMVCAGINVTNGLAVRSSSSTGNLYVSSTTGESRIFVLNSPLATPAAVITDVNGIGAHSATIAGYVNPNGPATLPYGLHTAYEILYRRTGEATFKSTVEAEAGRGTTNEVFSTALPGLEAATSYEVELAATRPYAGGYASTQVFSFTTSTAAPEVGTPTVATAATETAARAALYDTIDPNSKATSYRFEYGTSSSYEASVPVSAASAGSGGREITVVQYVNSLQPNTTYHFRLVATSASGESATSDQTFTTPPLGDALPSGRQAELVSQPEKGAVGYVNNFAAVQLYYQAAESGEAVLFPLMNGLEDSTAGGEVDYLATRSAEGWSSVQVTPPALETSPTPGASRAGAVRYFSPESLTCGIVETNSPITADVPAVDVEDDVYNMYRFDAAEDRYNLLTNKQPLNPGEGSGGPTGDYYEIAGASADCSRVFFKSSGGYTFTAGASGIYEWDEGALRDALTRPDGTVASGQASTVITAKNVVSSDGRFFFQATSDQGADSGKAAVFVRKSPTEVVDASQPTNGSTFGAGYETASPDGSQVLFLANYGIAASSSDGPTNGSCSALKGIGTTPCDLYDYDVETGQLTDISADSNPFDINGAVVQGVAAVSADGSTVYFVARGQLVAGRGRAYAQNLEGTGHANVYRYHAGTLAYVGSVAAADLSTFSGHVLIHDPTKWASQTNRSGSYFLFPSREDLAGGNPSEVEEAYLYSTATGSTQCVSCTLNGSAPHSRIEAIFVYPGLLAVSDQFSNSGNKYTRRSLSEEGRVIFSTEDALAPGAVEGHSKTFGSITYPVPTENNVYEWNQGQIALLATGEVEAADMGGPDGRDVYIKTFQQLAGQDHDFTFDLYDLRVGGGFPLQEPAERCDPEVDCQSEALVAPAGEQPASSVFAGPGDQRSQTAPAQKRTTGKSPGRAKKLAEALKQCRARGRARRTRCEVQARRRYGAPVKRKQAVEHKGGKQAVKHKDKQSSGKAGK
ncbi:MAG TPA: hypothetical protein VGF95_09450 [Solirubrobacteraceae bacterium]